ncbi:MAG: phosphoadenylyl-sulfate reductase [Crocinitomicaceae bacterium]|nr:phosphoadenylyl-sulfate reductase [Crocinitomicaceae bacterium]
MKNQAEQLLQAVKGKTLDEVLNTLSSGYADVVFSTSFGKEDQVITHSIFKNQNHFQIFTLDTGRLFEETYEVFQRTIQKYKLQIQTYYPDQSAIEKLLSQEGPYSFYESVENRKECCRIRKIEPLKRALAGKQIWITGLRREQSENRADMDMVEWDEANQIIKVHPIFEWTEREVDEYTDQHNVPVNALHKKGFPSIGCAPCTRAIQPEEDFRAGRWWWESSKKECGLHG